MWYGIADFDQMVLFIHEKFQFAVYLTKAKHVNQLESIPGAEQASSTTAVHVSQLFCDVFPLTSFCEQALKLEMNSSNISPKAVFKG